MGTMINGRAQRVMSAYFLASGLYKSSMALYRNLKHKLSYTVSVSSEDQVYNDLHQWLLSMTPERRRRSLRVMSVRKTDDWGDPIKSDEGNHIVCGFDSDRTQTVWLDGQRVQVETVVNSSATKDSMFKRRPDYMLFTTATWAGKQAILSFIESVAAERSASPPRLYMANKWSEWELRSDIPLRTLDTVFLADGIAESLVKDMETFIAREADYKRLGIPWRRGYVFHGPPGTGKTSLAKALATEFNLDMYYLPLSDMEADTNILSLISRIQRQSVLLLEDIDIVHAATARDDQGRGASLTGLLNGLDGVATPNGVITVMTTNNLNALDEALIRPGRADQLIEIDYMTSEQSIRVMESLTGLAGGTLPPVEGLKMSAADLIEVLKHHIGDPEGGWAAARKAIEDRRAKVVAA